MMLTMPQPERRPGQRQTIDRLIAETGIAPDTLTYVTRCCRQGDSWRLMAGELTAKLGRDVGYQWLHINYSGHDNVIAARAAYDAERAARLTPETAE